MRLPRLVAVLAITLATLAPTVRASATDTAQPLRPEEGQIERLYRAVFDRSPDPEGFAYWFRLRSTTTSLETIAAEFITSPEFAAVAGAPSDDEFVVRLYRNVLDREPDADGLEYWRQTMAAGLTRVGLLVLFSESAEFVASTDTVLEPLPPFRASIEPVDAFELGASWRAGCPVGPADLVQIEMSTVGFDGKASTGTLIVHRSVAEAVVTVFSQLYDQRYPIEQMVPVSRFDGDDNASMAANNTSAFNCRAVTSGASWSRHAYGRAIDVNPRQNPYV
ncbi:MAG: DUF4214 domain-containing protein, partial [Acidimicrobiales bacterium]